MSGLRKLAQRFANTPFHPQWLMPGGSVDERICNCKGTVLDVGAASRWVQATIAEDTHYVALDYPVTAIGLYGTRPDVYGDAVRLPFADGSVQAVTCYEVLEHVAEPESVMAEISRVLAPDGIAEITMPFLYPVHDAPHDYQRWTRHRWLRSADKVGLVVEVLAASAHPLHTAAVLSCLALAGPLQQAGRFGQAWRLPFVVVLVPAINVVAWGLAWLWPGWDAMTTGHRVLLRKPA